MTTQQMQTAPLKAAFSWRLLLAWVLAALVPSLAASLPIGRAFGELLDHVPHGEELAHKLDGVMLIDAFVHIGRNEPWLQGATTAMVLLALLTAPFAAGLAVASFPDPQPRFFGLVARAFENYGRLFRLLIVGLIPLSIAAGVSGLAMAGAQKHAEKAIVETSATNASHVAWLVTLVAIVLAQLTLDAARAQFAVDVELRSALKAWGRGVQLLLARPGAALARYLVPTLLSFVVATLLVAMRARTGTMLGFVLTQLAVAAIGWGRAGRILGLAQLTTQQARR